MTALDLAGLHERLDAKRETLALTWREVATQTGVSASTFSRLKNGRSPSVETFLAMLDWVGDDPLAAALALRKPRPTETNPDLREVLERLARIAENVMDIGDPYSDHGHCTFCGTPAGFDHEQWCGWLIANSLAPSDLTAVGRHARGLGYRRQSP